MYGDLADRPTWNDWVSEGRAKAAGISKQVAWSEQVGGTSGAKFVGAMSAKQEMAHASAISGLSSSDISASTRAGILSGSGKDSLLRDIQSATGMSGREAARTSMGQGLPLGPASPSVRAKAKANIGVSDLSDHALSHTTYHSNPGGKGVINGIVENKDLPELAKWAQNRNPKAAEMIEKAYQDGENMEITLVGGGDSLAYMEAKTGGRVMKFDFGEEVARRVSDRMDLERTGDLHEHKTGSIRTDYDVDDRITKHGPQMDADTAQRIFLNNNPESLMAFSHFTRESDGSILASTKDQIVQKAVSGLKSLGISRTVSFTDSSHRETSASGSVKGETYISGGFNAFGTGYGAKASASGQITASRLYSTNKQFRKEYDSLMKEAKEKINHIWHKLGGDKKGYLEGDAARQFDNFAYNTLADMYREGTRLLAKFGYKPSDVGAGVPGRRFAKDVAAAKEMVGEKLHEAGESVHRQLTEPSEPSLQEKMMDQMHRSAWQNRPEPQEQHRTTSGSNQQEESGGVINWLKNMFSENEQQGINVAATELTPGMLAGKNLKPAEMTEGAKEIYEQLMSMETAQGTQTQAQPQQQEEQGPPNTLLDIYSFSAKKQPVQEVQDVQASASGMTTGMAAGTGTIQRQDTQASAMTGMTTGTGAIQQPAHPGPRPEPARDIQGMAAGTGAIQPKPAHQPEPAYQAKESRQKEQQDNPLLEEITRPKNPDEFDE
jgi:hypothetical protein